MLLIDKDFNTIMNSALKRLENSKIARASKGEIARLLLAVFNEEFARGPDSNQDGFYDILKKEIVQAFLSYAMGSNLNAIGRMMNCIRNPEEEDTTYRWRISMQLRTLATANEMAIRLACLSVNGVDDVVLMPYTHGTGSGSIYIVSSNPEIIDDLIYPVQNAASAAGAFGNRIEVFKPRLLEVAIRMRLLFYKDTPEIDRHMLRSIVKSYIEDFINSLNIGNTFDIIEMKQTILRTNEQIAEVEIYYLTVNQDPVLAVKQHCAWNERFVESQEPSSIIVS